jgi:Polysaccharide biosynthesis enzyme WcbI
LKFFKTKKGRPCIVVTSNCQTHGIAQAIEALNQEYQIIAIWKLGEIEEVIRNMNEIEKDIIWITSCNHSQIDLIKSRVKTQIIEVVRIPDIWFDAFHPDLTYLEKNEGGVVDSILGAYHSRIAIWAFLNQINIDRTINLFNASVFREIGYFNKWGDSASILKKSFEDSDIPSTNLDELLLRKKKFMYSVNHTDQKPLSLIAGAALEKLNLSIRFDPIEHAAVSKDIQFWYGPTFAYYPEIAAQYGENGSYIFRSYEGKYYSLREFILGTWETYKTINFNTLKISEIIPVEFENRIRRHIK